MSYEEDSRAVVVVLVMSGVIAKLIRSVVVGSRDTPRSDLIRLYRRTAAEMVVVLAGGIMASWEQRVWGRPSGVVLISWATLWSRAKLNLGVEQWTAWQTYQNWPAAGSGERKGVPGDEAKPRARTCGDGPRLVEGGHREAVAKRNPPLADGVEDEGGAWQSSDYAQLNAATVAAQADESERAGRGRGGRERNLMCNGVSAPP